MTPKEEQKCQHVWCDIKGSECGKCHLCGAEKPPIQSWEERFDAARPEWGWMPSQITTEEESETRFFGYKWYSPATKTIHEVTDWGHIKKFVAATLQEQKEELLRVIENLGNEPLSLEDLAGTCEAGFHQGFKVALEELKRTISNL